jgi:hypothetical protein
VLYTDPSAIHRRDSLSPSEPASSHEICESGRIAIESGWGVGEGVGGASETVVVYVTNERPFLFIRMHIHTKNEEEEEEKWCPISTRNGEIIYLVGSKRCSSVGADTTWLCSAFWVTRCEAMLLLLLLLLLIRQLFSIVERFPFLLVGRPVVRSKSRISSGSLFEQTSRDPAAAAAIK